MQLDPKIVRTTRHISMYHTTQYKKAYLLEEVFHWRLTLKEKAFHEASSTAFSIMCKIYLYFVCVELVLRCVSDMA